MRRAAAIVVLAMALPAGASAQDCLARTPAGFVASARLPSGVQISIDGAFEASLEGRRARLSVPSLGITAQARVSDVEVQLVATVAAGDGVLLTPGSRIHASRVERGRATVGVLATDLSIESIDVPASALALAGAAGTERCAVAPAVPAEWDELERARAAGHEHRVREDVVLRRTAGGRVGRVHVVRGARVVRIEESGAWSRIVVDSDGTRAAGWIASELLEPAPAREVGGGGGGMGSARVSVGCLRGERGVETRTLARATELRDRPGGRALAVLAEGTAIAVGTARDGWIAVVGVSGVRRIPRDCSGDPTGIGWVPEAEGLAARAE